MSAKLINQKFSWQWKAHVQGLKEVMRPSKYGQIAAMKVSKILKSRHW